MAYFVVERNRDDGTLSIPLQDAYETRDAALTALSAATASGAVTLLGEVFIADLGSAVPVLVMPSAPPVPAPAETAVAAAPMIAPAEDADVLAEVAAAESTAGYVPEPGELDEGSADEAFSAWEPLGEIAAAESTLADALKRAATSLEEEGIVAPESIVSEGESDAEEPEVAVEEAGDAEAPAEAAGDDEAAWPWANVESYEIKVDAPELLAGDEQDAEAGSVAPAAEPDEIADDEAGTEVQDGQEAELESTAAETSIVPEEQSIITSAPAEGEEAYLPKPVILGDYLDSLSSAVEEEPAEPEEPADAAASTASDAEVPELSVLEEPVESEDVREPSPPEPVESEAVAADLPDATVAEEAEETDAASVPEVGYEATGELKLEDYSCPDCVYSNTCPKVGQTTPAECGSFQWRSE